MMERKCYGLTLTNGNQQPCYYPPGIYLGLSNEDYHADGALSNSGMKTLRNKEPIDYWHGVKAFNVNGTFKPQRTKAMDDSDMFHTRLLEPERFYETYQPAGEKMLDPKKKIMARRTYEDIEQSIAILERSQRAKMLFSGGVCEVSIFFPDPETGLMLRIRPDYLKPSVCIDYKAHAQLNKIDAKYHIAKYGYDVQAGVYVEGINIIRQMILKGEAGVYGDFPDQWLNAFLSEKDTRFVTAFQRKEAPFIVKTMEIATDIGGLGREKAREAITTYVQCLHEYGVNEWPSGGNDIELLTLDDMPPSIFYN
ncbi:MAG: PD-(D/E)XK nuclease-like domain-containing protein [Pseudomonadales bacterium]|nr:PD-(D/E)XK nuclease-like domain-containing protein [Pseudomonadales bacterium]